MVDVPGVTNWPAAPDTVTTLIQVRDLASTTLAADIDDNDMTITVASTAGWPAASVVTIEGEDIIYTAKTSTTLTVAVRGAFQAYGGSVAAPHLTGAGVSIKVIAATHQVLVDAILALQAKQGAGADTPAAGEFYKGTGAGTSGWSPLAGSEVNTALGYTAADAATLSSHAAASNPHSGSQPLDAELTAIAGLTSAADRVPYFTGSGTATLTALTAAGRALIDDADAAAQRATLGLGSIATQGASSVAITGGAITGITDLAIADGGTGASTAPGARTALGLEIGADVQAQDAELQALAGLTSAADRLPYFTGSGTAGLATFTAAGRALVDDADATAQRATLGLVIGTNVQAYDAELAALAGLTSAANKLPYFTGSGAASLADLTAAGRALIDDADAAAQRATLGLSNVDNTSDMSKPVSTAQAAADALKLDIADQAMVLLSGFPQVFSAVSAVNVNNCFTSAYRNYRILINLDSASAAAVLNMRLRSAGADSSGAAYEEFLVYGDSSAATLSVARLNSGTSWALGSTISGSPSRFMVIDIADPKNNKETLGHVKYAAAAAAAVRIAYGDGVLFHQNASAFDGFSLYPASGNITGELRVYGVKD